MRRLKKLTSMSGWALVDTLLALGLWSSMGLSLALQTRSWMVQQRYAWQHALATEWQADLFEVLRLASSERPVSLAWGERVSTVDCSSKECVASEWRNSLLAHWQDRMGHDLPQAQAWLAPWSIDPRLQAVGLRWPEAGAAPQVLSLNGELCPSNWRCVVALGWP